MAEDQAMDRNIDALDDGMIAARVRVFVDGLHPASNAKSLWAQPDGKLLITDGPRFPPQQLRTMTAIALTSIYIDANLST